MAFASLYDFEFFTACSRHIRFISQIFIDLPDEKDYINLILQKSIEFY